ncbi:ABC transporter substrate-binding protein [Streptomyces polyrhachis]|uniref:ABC transporter substrate-binding protein n=1 Tax=Streptomyces polyrhachis TaxID=1282885 RepID=A0ABW2GIX8_9ACTN
MLKKRIRLAGAALAALVLPVALAGCGGDSLEKSGGGGDGKGGGKTLVVGAAGFTEAQVMAELYAQVLKDAGFSASVKKLTNRELYEPELEKGGIDVVPEYAATLAEFLNAKVNGPEAPEKAPVASNDAAATVAALRKLAGPRGLTVLDAGDAVDQNAFAVSREFADKHGLKTLSDLGAAKLKVKLAAGDECPQRPFCEPGLEKTYKIDITAVDPKGVGTPEAKQAVQDGVDQLVLTTTTDATLEQYGLVLLADDKGLQNADNIVPVLNTKEASDPKVAAALGTLTSTLTTEDLIGLNRKVDADREKPADVATAYLEEKGLLGAE